MTETRDLLRLVVVGHVDHGKSTLIGRLLHDTDSLPDGKLEELQATARRRGMALEWSFVLDAFQAERDQAVTIDTTQIRFRTGRRDYVIIDAPGHREFLKNMIGGAAEADAAILVVDAAEGVAEQTRRHGYLLHLLGVRQVAVVVNKMDLVAYAPDRFAAVRADVVDYLTRIGVAPTVVLPIAARDGTNFTRSAPALAWCSGPTLVDALDAFAPPTPPGDQPLRLPIQDVYHVDSRRILVGRIESGRVSVGDQVLFSPSNKTAKVTALPVWNAPDRSSAEAGTAVGLTLDTPLFLERGEVISHPTDAPKLSDVFRVRLFWLGHRPLQVGQRLVAKLATAEIPVTVTAIDRVIDTDDLAPRAADTVARNGIAEVRLTSRALVALDEAARLPRTGRVVLLDGLDLVAGGLISLDGYPDRRAGLDRKATNLSAVDHAVAPAERAARNGHRGGVLWLTGLSGAGKSTLAMALERRLFQEGRQVYVLDGDNIRAGLNANLGFAPEDRAENIRRVGEVAALFADAGFIYVTAFISPYRADRAMARAAVERRIAGGFHEVYVAADLATCEARDPKGLYARARAGEIRDFTGIDAPYEAPDRPDLTVDTAAEDLDTSVERVMRYVDTLLLA